MTTAKLKYRILHPLERMFGSIEEIARRLSWMCAVCPDCGRNRYYGKACK